MVAKKQNTKSQMSVTSKQIRVSRWMAVILQQSNSKGPGAVGGFQLKKVEVFSFTKISECLGHRIFRWVNVNGPNMLKTKFRFLQGIKVEALKKLTCSWHSAFWCGFWCDFFHTQPMPPRFPGTWAELLDRNAAQYKTVSGWHRSHQRLDVAVNMVWTFLWCIVSWVETMMIFIYIYIYYLWTLGVWVIPEMVDSQASRKTYLRRLQRSVWIYVQRRTVWAMMTLAKPISTKVMSNQLDISGEPYHCTDLIEAYSRTSISLASDHLVPSFAPSTPDEHDESFIR